MSYKQYIFYIICIVIILLLCVLGNIITIGDKLMDKYRILGWIYYVLITVILVTLVVAPILRVALAPEIGERHVLSEDTSAELKHKVHESAKLSLLMTTVSHNGSLDILANAIISFRMIQSIVKEAGYRPSLPQLFKLYSSVILTSYIVASVDEALDNLDLAEMIGNSGLGIMLKLVKPILNGVTNAFICMRVGYTTIRYLEEGHKQFNISKSTIRKEVARDARKDLLPVIKSEVQEIAAKMV